MFNLTGAFSAQGWEAGQYSDFMCPKPGLGDSEPTNFLYPRDGSD